jgi:hypothetical protein
MAARDSLTSYINLFLEDSDLDILTRIQARYHLVTKDEAIRFAIRYLETFMGEAIVAKEVG